MPEITIPGLRDVGNGPSEAQHAMLEQLRQNRHVSLWAQAGTEEECEKAWEDFLLAGTPDWIIYS